MRLYTLLCPVGSSTSTLCGCEVHSHKKQKDIGPQRETFFLFVNESFPQIEESRLPYIDMLVQWIFNHISQAACIKTEMGHSLEDKNKNKTHKKVQEI